MSIVVFKNIFRSGVLLLLLFWIGMSFSKVYGQHIAVKTNLLEWGMVSPNVGVELVLGRKVSLELTSGFNFIDSKKRVNYFRIQPEVRYWLERPLVHHFVGLSTLFVRDNIHIDEKHFKGDLFGAGITYGYNWILGERWNLEATLGLGVVKYRQFKWREGEKKPASPNNTGVAFAPIKAGISFIYIFR